MCPGNNHDQLGDVMFPRNLRPPPSQPLAPSPSHIVPTQPARPHAPRATYCSQRTAHQPSHHTPQSTTSDPTPSDFLTQHTSGAQRVLAESVSAATQRRYQDCWPRWCAFLDRSYPDQQRHYVPHRLSEQALLTTLLAFVSHLRSDLQLSNAAISVSLSGLRFELRTRLFDSPALHSSLLFAASQAPNPNGAQRKGSRTPFTTSMVLSMSAFADEHPHIRHRMHAIGAILGYFCALRASEYCICRESHHTLRAEAVEFEYEENLQPSTRAPTLTLARVTAVRITIHTAKNIAPGKGQSVWFSAQHGTSGESTFSIVNHLFHWSQAARLSPGDPFLSYQTSPGVRVCLQYTAMNAAIKAAAVAAGINPAGCGTHSLRGGAATSLVAAGASDAAIMNAGRWRSLPTAAAYPDRSSQSNDQQLAFLQSSTVSTRDIRMARCLPSPPPSVQPPPSPTAVPPSPLRAQPRGTSSEEKSPRSSPTTPE